MQIRIHMYVFHTMGFLKYEKRFSKDLKRFHFIQNFQKLKMWPNLLPISFIVMQNNFRSNDS